jgi:cytochrome c
MSAFNRIPGDQFALTAVHPGYDLFQARPGDFLPRVGGMDFLSDGTMVISTWDAAGSVYLLRNVESGDPAQILVQQIASGLAEPLGVKVVDDEIYVLQKQELTQLVDTDGDGITDEYRAISNRWQTSGNFHEFAFGLEYRDGYFYANLAIAIDPGGASTQPQVYDRGRVMKISQEDGSVEFIAHGLRTPNGIGWGVDNELFVSDNQGDWLPSSKILHVSPGAWFGSRAVDWKGTEGLTMKPPVVWLPQDEIGNSPGNPILLRDGPYKGQMIHGEVTHGGIKRVFV